MSKPKIFVDSFPIQGSWGGGNMFVKAFYHWAPKMGIEILNFENNDNYTSADYYLCLNLSGQFSKWKFFQDLQINHNPRIILRINENDLRKKTKGMDNHILSLIQFSNKQIFVSEWLQKYFDTKKDEFNKDYSPSVDLKNSTVIVNGVDEIFHPRPKNFNSKIKIMTHHWSDNYFKGEEAHQWIDDLVGKYSNQFEYTFIGRSKYQFRNSRHFPPMTGIPLAEELASADLYINGSLGEPASNSILEALATQLPVYVRHSSNWNSGASLDFVGDDHCFENYDQLEQLILSKNYQKNNIQLNSWETVIRQALNFILTN